jgi:WD40 repeat protein
LAAGSWKGNLAIAGTEMFTVASYLFTRADDHLVIGVRWVNFTRTDVDVSGVPMLVAGAKARLVVLLPPQHVGEETSPRGSAAPVQLPAGTAAGSVPAWRGVLSGGSRVVVAFEAGTRIPLSAEGVLAAMADHPLRTSPGVPGADDTAIELPWRLLLTPGGRSAAGVACRHHVLPVVSRDVSGLWRTRLVDAATPSGVAGPDAGLTLLAPDEATAAAADPAFARNNALPLTQANRLRICTETRHRPASARRLELSTLGGTLDAVGTWPNFEWEHHAVLGRDMKVRTLAKGAMYPFGHRALFLQVSERVFDPAAGDAAVLRVLRVLTIVEPVRRAPADGPVRRGFPMGDVEITETTFVNLADPVYQHTVLPVVGSKATHFWPTTLTGEEVRFPIRCATSTGDIRFELPLLFVADLRDDFDTLASPELAARLADDYGGSRAALPAAAIDVVDAAGRTDRAAGDRHEVHSITVAGIREGLDLRDGYRPTLAALEVSLPALRVLRGDDRLSTVQFTPEYLRNGAEDVVLKMLPGQVRDIDFTAAADRSGGLVAPRYDTDAISRTLGLVNSAALPNPATGFIDPASLFPSDNASLLGLPLKSLLTGLKLPPEITSVPRPGAAPEVHMRWHDVAVKSVGPFVAGPTTRLDLDVTVAPNHAETVCTLREFALELPPGSKRVLRLKFRELRFTQRDGRSPSVDVSGVEAEFLGALKLLEKLQDAVDLGAAGKLLDVSPRGISVRYSLPLPPVASGVFVMRDLALSAGIDVPFDGAPVSVALAFASRANPFNLSVMMFGGGGYVDILLDRDGLRRFEAALEFGAFVAVDFVVASGEVHALGGVRFALEANGAVTLAGYLRIGGCVEVLGLITVSVELCLTLAYNSTRNALVGRATLVLEIDLTLWSDSVELDTGEWVFAGGDADRRHPLDHLAAAEAEQDALARWIEYRAAYAAETRRRALPTEPALDTRDAAADEQFRVVFEAPITNAAYSVVWSPDDRRIAASGGLGFDRPNFTMLDAASGAVLWRLSGYSCGDVAFSPDGRRIAISTFSVVFTTPTHQNILRIRMLDAETGVELWQVPGDGLLDYSPDGTLLACHGVPDPAGSSHWPRTFVLDAETGALLHTQGRSYARPAVSRNSDQVCTGSPALVDSRTGEAAWWQHEHETDASACAFTRADDGVLFASGRWWKIYCYERTPTGGVERFQVEAPGLQFADSSTLEALRFSPDRGMVAFIGRGKVGAVAVADGRTAFMHETQLFANDVVLAFRPDGSQLATNYALPWGQPDPGVVVYDTATGERVWDDPGPAVTGLAFSGDGSRIAAGGEGFVRVYEVGRPVRTRHDCGARVTEVAVGDAEADVAAAITGGDEPTLTVFRATSGEMLLRRVHAGVIAAVAVSPDGQSAATGTADGRCRHFDTQAGTRWSARHGGPVNAVAFSTDSRWLATASSDRTARLFDRRLSAGADPENHQPRWARQHPQSVTRLALGSDLAWVATAALDRTIRILAGATGEQTHAFEHDARINALVASTTGMLAAASADGSASVIDVVAGRRRHRIEHPGPLVTAAISSDGSLLATAGDDAEIHLWRVDGPEAVPLHRFTARAPVTALAFDPVDHRLVVASEDPVVRILEPVGWTETERLIHPEPATHVAFGPDGALLVTACDDNHARVYEMRHR